MRPGQIVTIYPRGNSNCEPEGVAELIEKCGDWGVMERWFVRFKGESRLLKRIILPDDLKMSEEDKGKYLSMRDRMLRKDAFAEVIKFKHGYKLLNQ